MELNITSREHPGHSIVTASGEIDLYTAPALQAEFTAIASGSRVIVDLSGVEFCDSTGMNVLLSAMKRSREGGGSFELAGPRPAVRKVLQVTGLDEVFVVHDSVHTAVSGA